MAPWSIKIYNSVQTKLCSSLGCRAQFYYGPTQTVKSWLKVYKQDFLQVFQGSRIGSPQSGLRPNTTKYEKIRKNKTKYDQIQPNMTKYDIIRHNTTKYDQMRPNTTKYDQIRPHTTTYDHIRPNTTTCDQIRLSYFVVLCRNLRRIMPYPSYFVVVHSGGT